MVHGVFIPHSHIIIWSIFITFRPLSLASEYLKLVNHILSSLIAAPFHKCAVHGRQYCQIPPVAALIPAAQPTPRGEEGLYAFPAYPHPYAPRRVEKAADRGSQKPITI